MKLRFTFILLMFVYGMALVKATTPNVLQFTATDYIGFAALIFATILYLRYNDDT